MTNTSISNSLLCLILDKDSSCGNVNEAFKLNEWNEMTTELYAIAGNSLIHFLLLFFAQQLYNDFVKGLRWSFSNREDQEFDAYSERVKRTIANHIESTVIFVPLALAVVVAGKSSQVTQVGSLIFVFSRLGYAICYLAGIPYIRSFIWFFGVIGYWMVAWPFLEKLF